MGALICQKYAKEGQACLLFPSEVVARECVEFLTSPKLGEKAILASDMQVRPFDLQMRLWTVFFPMPNIMDLGMFWANAGDGLSLRAAAECLKHADTLVEALPDTSPPLIRETSAYHQVKERIARLLERAPLNPLKVSASDIYLYQTGMAAIYHIHRYPIRQARSSFTPFNQTVILFGFAFHSTPHTLEDYGHSYKQFQKGTEYSDLESFIKAETAAGRGIQALWCEFPANPLLVTPDLARLRALATEFSFALIVDDTVGSFCNVDVLSNGADIVVTSITKSFSGYSDVMGASAVLNASSPLYPSLKALFETSYWNDLFPGDAEKLLSNSTDYLERSAVLNANGLALATFLHDKASDPTSSVAGVFYPFFSETAAHYKARMRPVTPDFNPGYNCLFSVSFATVAATRVFYDKIGTRIHIGPHLGAHRTLCLAYVKGLYSGDLQGTGLLKVKDAGLDERQLRVSAGLENIEELLAVFGEAVDEADRVWREEKAREEGVGKVGKGPGAGMEAVVTSIS